MKTDLSEDGWQGFLKLCLAAPSSKELKEMFDLFFTIEEKKDIANRYLIIQAFVNGTKTQRELAEDLQISISKITRGSNALKIISRKLREFLQTQMN